MKKLIFTFVMLSVTSTAIADSYYYCVCGSRYEKSFYPGVTTTIDGMTYGSDYGRWLNTCVIEKPTYHGSNLSINRYAENVCPGGCNYVGLNYTGDFITEEQQRNVNYPTCKK